MTARYVVETAPEYGTWRVIDTLNGNSEVRRSPSQQAMTAYCEWLNAQQVLRA